MEITAEEERTKKTSRERALVIVNGVILSVGTCGGPLMMRLYFINGGKLIWFSSFLETAAFPIMLLPIFFPFLLRCCRHNSRNCNTNSNSVSISISSNNSNSNNRNSNSVSISISSNNSNTNNHNSNSMSIISNHETSSQNKNSGNNSSEDSNKTAFFLMKPRLFAASAVIGVLMGLDNFLYAYGLAYLPVSTSSLIIASQLAFTALFAFFMVKHKFTPFSINAVVLLTIGAGVLALHTDSDKPAHESHKQYIVGFIMTLASALLYAFILPSVELTYKKAGQNVTYRLVLEIQMVTCAFATAFCVIGMFVNGDFKAIPREARGFKLGETMYYVVVASTAIIWQGFFLGAIGIIFRASALVSGILVSVLLPITEILAVVCFREKFQSEKAVSLALSLWGFASYFYGEIKSQKAQKQTQQETELPRLQDP